MLRRSIDGRRGTADYSQDRERMPEIVRESSEPGSLSLGSYRFHHLTYLDEGHGEVTVGRLDRATFVILSDDVADLLRQLEAGLSQPAAAEWYLARYGEEIDVADFLCSLDELGFLLADGESPVPPQIIRWRRLAGWVFSSWAYSAYLSLVVAALVLVIRSPGLRPQPSKVIYLHSLTFVMVSIALGQVLLVLIHEAAHALAGRRLGLPSQLSIGRRFYFLVVETNLDSLVSVPRKQRWVPILAGMGADLVLVAVLELGAAILQAAHAPVAGAGFLLALAYLSCLRIAWQFWFFLETDIYQLIATFLGTNELHATARQVLRNRFDRLRGRALTFDPDSWHPRDRAAAQWFSVLMVVGYTVCSLSLLLNLPIAAEVISIAGSRVLHPAHRSMLGIADVLIFLLLSFAEPLTVLYLLVRERRRAFFARRHAANV